MRTMPSRTWSLPRTKTSLTSSRSWKAGMKVNGQQGSRGDDFELPSRIPSKLLSLAIVNELADWVTTVIAESFVSLTSFVSYFLLKERNLVAFENHTHEHWLYMWHLPRCAKIYSVWKFVRGGVWNFTCTKISAITVHVRYKLAFRMSNL